MEIEVWLRELHRQGGSDLHLKVDRPPLMRVNGDLMPTEAPPLSDSELRAMLYDMMGERVVQKFEETLEADFSYEVEGIARFRVNVFIQRGRIGSVMRLIPLEVPTVEALGLPPVLKTVAENVDGLVLVTGPTGSGKSTTLASMIEHINETAPVHIITIEDPIEFVYRDQMATINQRELNIDTTALHGALRAALRQDPDVILMGEMRDPETINFGITAAETGHLVFATLHTNDAKQTLERILDTVPPDARDMVRSQLAILLRAIICQHLCRRSDGTGRIAAQEILVNSPQMSQLIEEGKTRSIDRALMEGEYYGMQTFNQALYKLVQQGLISQDEALTSTASPEDLKLMFRGIKRGTSSDETAGGGATGFTPPRPAPGQAGGGGSGGQGGLGGQAGPAGPKKPKIDRGFDF
jgi:twitching motility protein PilT